MSEAEAPVHEEPGAKPRSAHPVWSFFKEIAIVLIGAMIISTVLRMFILQMFEIPSGSMENTLQKNDRVVVLKFADFKRGDIVVFKDSFGWLKDSVAAKKEIGPLQKGLEFVGLLPDSSQDHLIKRVVGVEGDTVQCCDAQSRLTVNGVPLDESAYLYSRDGSVVKPSDIEFKVVVPKGRLFVMGDHRNQSADSRCHLAQFGINAFVRREDVVGPAVAIGFPFNRMTQFSTPQAFSSVQPPGAPAPETPVIEPAGVSC